MAEKHVAFDSIPNEDQEIAINGQSHGNNANANANATIADHGWQKVTYAKRQRKGKPSAASDSLANGNSKIAAAANGGGGENVFRSLEQQSEDRRRRILEAQRAANDVANAVALARSKVRSDDDDEDEDSDEEIAPGSVKPDESKKVKVKKPKKPKVTVSEAAEKIDASHLSAFLAEISVTYQSKEDLQLMRFADYFGQAFWAVNSAQFPWMKMLRESTVAKMVDIPLSHISESVYKTSIDWINQHSIEALGSFVLWSLESLLADFASQHASAKGSKKGVQHASSKSQVAIFMVVAMVLRRKPDVLVNVLSKLREESKYQGQDKLPLIVWVILQASQGDLAVGLYAWARNLLPLVSGKSSNPQSRDLVLQLVERILSMPKARIILVNAAVRKGERLIPPTSFEILMRVTFPTSSVRVKATERFEVIYPTLKDVALAGSSGSKAMKQVTQQILSFAIKAAGESTPELANEATTIFIWCLSQNVDSYKQWDNVYDDNLKASVAVLKKLSDQWKELSGKLFPLDKLKETVKSFKHKNEKALTGGTHEHELIKEADKYCKHILGKLSRSNGCVKSMFLLVIALAVGAAVISPNMESLDLKNLSATLSSLHSF